ncbi:hypothetical protein ABS71_13395 [bacterium SCN 62-11]|nr:hypothetical protein [Candidatus Eremiobacteraeota bacterium]ODT64289.1 MAG: hypothetical protein ABS71_13395 [bacterium SCN 62-11]
MAPNMLLLVLAACVLTPSLLTAIFCWPLMARGRRFAPYLVLLSWFGGSTAAGFWLLSKPEVLESPVTACTPAVLSTALLFWLLTRLFRNAD